MLALTLSTPLLTSAGKDAAMLCISRREGQEIKIGNATVKVLETTAGKVRLGITAPPEIPIVRDDCKCKERKDRARKVA